MQTLIFIAIVLIVLIFTSIQSQREMNRKKRKQLLDEFEKPLERELDYNVYQNIRIFDEMTSGENELHIDADTWDDLNMDDIYMQMNNTNSSIGREYLYYMLHNPFDKEERLKEIDRLSREFTQNEDWRIKMQEQFSAMGYAGRASVYDYIHQIMKFSEKSNLVHYLMQLWLIASIFVMIFFRADFGIVLFVFAIGMVVISYFKEKVKIENYLECAKCIVRMIDSAREICKMKIPFIQDYQGKMEENMKHTAKITKRFFLVTTGSSYSGSLFEIGLDYIRIIFHADLIRFNQLVKEIKENSTRILEMYETLGFLESCIAVAAFRNKLLLWCVPSLKKGNSYHVVDVYHPLLDNPVANSLNTGRCILLTGSNASGKSTFLRSIAVNALLSQTIATGIARKYEGDYYQIVSSMSHRDDLVNGDSYYMVEIKALKRILDMAEQSGHKVLCFLDEVLRGTNTVERIAASTQILKSFATGGRTLCFAATHDIELTWLLDGYYENHHFDESFENNDVQYNYILKDGPAVTRNAIKLLAQTGYDKKLIADAVRMTEEFEKNNVWRMET